MIGSCVLYRRRFCMLFCYFLVWNYDAIIYEKVSDGQYEYIGDFGDENVDIVRDVCKLDLPKAVILGNHDCWKTVSPFAPYMLDVSYSWLLSSQLFFLGLINWFQSRCHFSSWFPLLVSFALHAGYKRKGWSPGTTESVSFDSDISILLVVSNWRLCEMNGYDLGCLLP